MRNRGSWHGCAEAFARCRRGQSEVGFDLRLRLEIERKQAIARAAAAIVEEGEAVALDASTTAYYLALELRTKRELVVITNGLLVATALADAPGITVLVTGGMLRLSAMSLVGDLGTDVLRTTRINKGFLGARGLSLERGLMDLNPDEVRIKQKMASACEQVYGILDGTKWHRSALLAFVDVEHLTGIVTDSSAPADEVEAWRAAGVERHHRRPGAAQDIAGAPARPAPRRPQRRGDRLVTVMAAVDLGAQSGRVAVGTFDGERLVLEEAHRFANEPVRVRGTLHWDVLRLYQDALDGLRRAARTAARSTASRSTRGPSTSASSTAPDGCSSNPVHYRDARRAAAVERRARAGAGTRAVRAHRHPAARDQHRSSSSRRWRPVATRRSTRADTLLLIPDLIHYWLCGSRSAEYTNATTTQCLDAAHRRAGRSTCSTASRSPRPAARDRRARARVLGTVTPDVADVTGLAGGDRGRRCHARHRQRRSPVSRSRGPDAAFLSVGTWSLVGIESRAACITDGSFAANLTNEGGVGGTFRVLRNVTGLWLLHECRRCWALEGSEHSFERARRARALGARRCAA